jgi:oxygen-dependent protoporphyrinogen oxidase
MLGIIAEPLFYRERRWQAGYPQYDVGHDELVSAIREALPPGAFVAGLSYDGVGVPDTIRGARDAVHEIKEMGGAKIEA